MKICGITRVNDALVAAHAGADAIGLVFYPPSPRCVTVDQAEAISRALPPFVTVVALFVDAASEQVREVVQRVGVDLLQFHGDESPDVCASHGRPWVKALRMRPGVDVTAQRERYRQSRGLLLDAFHPAKPGGTGQTFSWDLIPPDMAQEIILAGGLTADNVGQAVRSVRPWAVDVSGGVESSPGVKDARKIADFIQGASRVKY